MSEKQDEKKQAQVMTEETRRLLRGLEAFAYAVGINANQLAEGLRVVLGTDTTPVIFKVPSPVEKTGFRAPVEVSVTIAQAPSSPVEPSEPLALPAPDPAPVEPSPVKVEGKPNALVWMDYSGMQKGSIRLRTSRPPENWRLEVFHPEGMIAAEAASFVGAYSNVVDALGASVGGLLAVPSWAQTERGAFRAARLLIENAIEETNDLQRDAAIAFLEELERTIQETSARLRGLPLQLEDDEAPF